MSSLARRWGGASVLEVLLASVPGDPLFVVRDFALATVAATLAERFPGYLLFKGGFVLRHARRPGAGAISDTNVTREHV